MATTTVRLPPYNVFASPRGAEEGMKIRIEIVAVDCLMVRLFDTIDEANMPWLLAASGACANASAKA
jgi:hypothetical protein